MIFHSDDLVANRIKALEEVLQNTVTLLHGETARIEALEGLLREIASGAPARRIEALEKTLREIERVTCCLKSEAIARAALKEGDG